MSRGVPARRNGKMEAFLVRKMNRDQFERVRCTEACLLCSDVLKLDKAFSYVVLSDEWIYFTQNPPQTLKKIISLQDVTAITLRNDYAAFLSGAERDNTQHIVIEYIVSVEVKQKEKNSKGGSTARTPRTPKSSARNSSSDDLSSSSASIELEQPPPAEPTPGYKYYRYPRGSKYVKPPKPPNDHPSTLTPSSSNASIRSLSDQRPTDEQSGQEQSKPASGGEETKKKGKSASKQEKKKKKKSGSLEDEDRASTTSQNLASTMLNRMSSSKYKADKHRPLPNPAEDFDENGDLIDKRKKAPSLRFSFDDKGKIARDVKQEKRNRNKSGGKSDSGDNNDDGDGSCDVDGVRKSKGVNDDDGGGGGGGDDDDDDYDDDDDDDNLFRPQTPLKSILKRPPGVPKIDLRTGSDSDDEDSRRMSTGSLDDYKTEDTFIWQDVPVQIHIYILNNTSPFLMLARSALNNYMIRHTLEWDEEYYKKTLCYTPRRALGMSSDIDQLFNQMKHEILHVDPTFIEKVFSLVNELKTAAERLFLVKKFFWKTADLFKFLVHQLQMYLPRSPHWNDNISREEYKEVRADEFELLILVVDTLAVMFRETETLPSRLQILQASQGKVVLDLLVVMTCEPETPGTYRSTTQQSPKPPEWQSAVDIELSKLCQEFTNAVTGLFFELIIIAHMANWGDSTGCFLNITWITKVLEQLTTTEWFVESVIVQTMRLIWPSRKKYLKPVETVLLYQQFTVLQTVLEFSSPIADYVKTNFYEEFKYYVQAPVICDKFPVRYMIRDDTLKLIEEVMEFILNRRVRLLSYT